MQTVDMQTALLEDGTWNIVNAGTVTGGYLPDGFGVIGEITSVTQETPVQDFQIQAGFPIRGTVYANPDAPLVVYACVTSSRETTQYANWKDCYIRFVNPDYQEGLIRMDGTLNQFTPADQEQSELLTQLPKGCTSAGTIQKIVWDRHPDHDLEVNGIRDTYGKSLYGREVFRNPADNNVIYLYEEQCWREDSSPAWRVCHLWEG